MLTMRSGGGQLADDVRMTCACADDMQMMYLPVDDVRMMSG